MKLESPHLNIVLIEPEIPNNTGSIGRTCVGTGCRLHLVGHLGFEIDDKAVRRAGLDYWKDLDFVRHDSTEKFLDEVVKAPDIQGRSRRFFFFSKKASRPLFDIHFEQGDWLVFGKETVGLDEALLRRHEEQTVRIPQWGPIRSLNLSNAVSVAIYEAMRQIKGL